MAAFAAGRPYYGALKPQAARRIDDGHRRSDERPKRRLNPATERRKSSSKGDFEPHGGGIWRGTSRNCTFRRKGTRFATIVRSYARNEVVHDDVGGGSVCVGDARGRFGYAARRVGAAGVSSAC